MQTIYIQCVSSGLIGRAWYDLRELRLWPVMRSLQEIYSHAILPLSKEDQLKLAEMIVRDIRTRGSVEGRLRSPALCIRHLEGQVARLGRE